MLAEIQHQAEGARFLSRFVSGQLTSPLLLVGLEGTGRRFSVTKAVQEAFCSDTRSEGCTCSSCYQIANNIHPDLIQIKAGAKDIGIDEIRTLIAEAKHYPSVADVRCFILDGADRLTVPAANAFLKTLEEAPARSRFFLLAEVADRVLPTIRSRCGLVRYHPLPEPFILSVVQQYESNPTKALVYSRLGEGSVGGSIGYWGSGRLTLRDQVLKALQLAAGRDLAALFSLVDSMEEQSLVTVLKFMNQVLHDVLIFQVDPMRVVNLDRPEALQALRQSANTKTWSKLSLRVQDLDHRYRVSPLHLPFHLKTILVETFI